MSTILVLLSWGCASAQAGRNDALTSESDGTAKVGEARAREAKLGEVCEGADGPGNCAPGLLCCTSFHGQCGGAYMPDVPREPCVTSTVCANVERCWGPPP